MLRRTERLVDLGKAAAFIVGTSLGLLGRLERSLHRRHLVPGGIDKKKMI